MAPATRVQRPARDFLIRAGAVALLEGREVKIIGVHSLERIQLRFEDTSEYVWASAMQLEPIGSIKETGSLHDVQSSDPEQERLARKWTSVLRDAARAGGGEIREAERLQIAAKMEVSGRTVQRRWALYLQNPVPGSQLPGLRGPRPGSRRLAPVVESIIEKAIDDIYLVREPATITSLVNYCGRLAKAAGVKPPSLKAVRERVRRREPLKVAKKRLGYHQAVAQQSPSVRGLSPTSSLEMVQIDHALIDLIVVSPLTRQPIGRPWITVAIDVLTRCVTGYYLSFDTPNQTSVALALERSCFPKQAWLRGLGLDVSYPIFGKMRSIHWDNAKTFQAKGIKAQCGRYGIHIQERPVRSPHYGAYIERYIGTMMGAVHLLPGTTFSNSKARGDYPSERRAVMSLPDLEKWLALEVAGVYHNKPHRGLDGQTPLQAWTQAWTDSSGAIVVPPIIGDARDFVIGLLPSVQRRVGREGVSVNGLKYWDPALTPFINSHIDRRVHFDQRDLTKVYLHTNVGYVDIPLKDRSRSPFSLWELRELRSYLKASGRKASGESDLFDAMEQQRTIHREAAATSKAARRKMARIPEPTSVTPSSVDYSETILPLPLSEGVIE
ncbi:transposase [Stenotrophomonas bentonitica]